MVEAPGASVPFYIKPIVVDLEGVHYVGPILLGTMVGLLSGRRATYGNGGGGGGGGGGGDPKIPRWDPLGWERGYGRIMMCTCLPYPFKTGRTCGTS